MSSEAEEVASFTYFKGEPYITALPQDPSARALLCNDAGVHLHVARACAQGGPGIMLIVGMAVPPCSVAGSREPPTKSNRPYPVPVCDAG